MRCGHCRGEHDTVQDVRLCYATPIPAAEAASTVPAQPTRPAGIDPDTVPDTRVKDIHDVLVLLAAYHDHVDVEQLRAWAQDPATALLIGFRVRWLHMLATAIRDLGDVVTPYLLYDTAHAGEASVGRDGSSVLEGRDQRYTGGGHRSAPGESDRDHHRRIGTIHQDE